MFAYGEMTRSAVNSREIAIFLSAPHLNRTRESQVNRTLVGVIRRLPLLLRGEHHRQVFILIVIVALIRLGSEDVQCSTGECLALLASNGLESFERHLACDPVQKAS